MPTGCVFRRASMVHLLAMADSVPWCIGVYKYSAWAKSFFLKVKALQGPQVIRMSVEQGSTLFLYIYPSLAEPETQQKLKFYV